MVVKGKSICFTGKLYNFTRNQARAMAVNAGMIILETVSSRLDYLVMADKNSTSSKARKARQFGVTLLSENDFLDMLGLDRKTVETETEYKKTHKPAKVLDWKKCFDIMCQKLGLTYKKTSVPVYERGKDERYIDISLSFHGCHIGSSSDVFTLKTYNGNKLTWTDDDKYVEAEDDAFQAAVWMLGCKLFRLVRSRYWTDIFVTEFERMKNSYPEFGMPSSTDELKLKLEILGWSILDDAENSDGTENS